MFSAVKTEKDIKTASYPRSSQACVDLYCKFGNFREDFIFAKLRISKFRENKTLAKWQNHSVVY